MELMGKQWPPPPSGRIDRRTGIRVYVLVDALGWALIRDRRFLDTMLPYQIGLRTVLGYSSAAIPTILTGTSPDKHRYWNLLSFDPPASPFRWLRCFSFLPDAVLDHRCFRKLLKECGRRVLGLGPLFECCVSPRLLPLLGWNDCPNPFLPGSFPGLQSIFDRLAEAETPFCSYSFHSLTDDQIVAQASTDIETGKAAVFFLYLSELDHFLHLHCQHPLRVQERLDRLAEGLRALFSAALGRDPGAHLAVFSDHGMTPVTGKIDLTSGIRSTGLKTPDDYLAVYDSTMARFWFFSDQARHQISSYLDSVAGGSILEREELVKLGIAFDDRRYGELMFLLEPGLLISGSGFNNGRWSPHGMHGYHPDDPRSDGVFLSNRRPETPLRTIADIHRALDLEG
jgi:hypothetical protein